MLAARPLAPGAATASRVPRPLGRIARYNPTTAEWTFFDTPVRGTEIRHVSLLELPGQDTKVTVPLYRNSKMGAMTLRTEAEIAALKAQASN